MAENSAPFIRLGEDGESAPILSYSIPESTNYVGYNVISVDISDDYLNEKTKEELRTNLKEKKSKGARPIAPDRFRGKNIVYRTEKSVSVSNRLELVDIYKENPTNMVYLPKEGFLGFSGGFNVIKPKPREEKIFPKILFYERIQLSNFLGNYGAGKVIKTFSLFPGEKTKISIKTYKRTSETEERNEGSSILDSTSNEAALDFENSLNSESSTKISDYEADVLNHEREHNKREGSASALWGLAKAKVSVDLETERTGEWGTRSARDDFSKNVSNALSKHSSRASSKRDVNINTTTSTSSSTEEGQETTIEREIQNINLSRTLNLVFRQMNQEFVSVTHLTDVKIALYDESSGPYPKFSLYELDNFLDEYFVDNEERRTMIKNGIIRELYYIFNYVDKPIKFLEKKTLEFPTATIDELGLDLPEKVEFLRIRKDEKDVVQDTEHIKVQGVILDVNKITMRTDGIVVDAFLGQGEALDNYNIKLQNEATRQAKLDNDKTEQAIKILDGIREPNEKASLYKKIFSDCCDNPQSCCCHCNKNENE